jgi:hypothetical protein
MKILFDNGTQTQLLVFSLAMRSPTLGGLAGRNLETANLFKVPKKPVTKCFSGPTKISCTSRIFEGRKIALVVLGNQQWPLLKLHLDKIAAAVNTATPGSFTEVDIPPSPAFS